MKKTVLKINDLNMVSERYGKLEHVSFQVMEGEITGLLGLNYSGKELIAQILLGSEEPDWQQSQILVDSRKVRKYADIRNLVYHISYNNSVIKNFTV
ncbi:MAG: ATP-binding cassette domain-containing protein [Clostridiales bacterium]|nr:ATP-binding cassette domain-containing protein [Clostridiales bacterium]